MIGISKLYMGAVEQSDVIRYGARSKDLPSHLLQFSEDKKPVVVFNCTRRCNLRCIHCYSDSENLDYAGELDTGEAKGLIEDLASFGSPVILFSGGEPLMRRDLVQLVDFAVEKGIRAVISTNGTLITKRWAREMKLRNLSYVGVSLDGLRKTHDSFRRTQGAFDRAIGGVENCMEEGIKVGLRFTINRMNMAEIPGIFDMVESMEIPRICFYHLVVTGRGGGITDLMLSHDETRGVLDLIMERTKKLFEAGQETEVLTVDNHADGPYIYLKLKEEDPARAEEVMGLLIMNKGNSSGLGIGCVGWDGEVYPDQFWRSRPLGNVRERPFSEIWTDTTNTLMARLKKKGEFVKGRCASCRWLDVCAGNFRARAEAMTGDTWAADPACYLTDEEIGIG
ncbi:MAG: 12,18-didecarboxysiroheme deacetylase [Deltaproteobacteria bacterium]|uniref:12,18-didecarboxysiroheme deacetylase n=1 Tax=Candidatus Zymogenus saltonus TaxID=2844893 RepID=A0A9D8KDH1_9DELT|nr:12,18-didecarboxysiroheme deacetylase [Candidatus Zymogenus saltonus]